MSRKLKILLVVLGGLLALVIVLLATIDLDEVLTATVNRFLPRVEQALGRSVKIERVSTTVFTGFGAKLEGITVGPRADAPAGAPPFARAEQIRVSLAAWPALVSKGKDLQIREVAIRGLEVDLVRRPDGTLSYDDIVQRLTAGEEPAEPSAPLTEEELAYLRGLKVKRIALEDAALRFTDEATGGAPFQGRVEGLTIEVLGLQASEPLELRVRARVFADRENLRLGARTLPLPADLISNLQPGLTELSLWVEQLDVTRLTPYLGQELPVKLVSSTLDADLQATGLAIAPDSETKLRGTLRVTGLQLEGGEPFDLRLAPDVTVRGVGDEVDLHGLTVEIAGMKLEAAGELRQLLSGLPRFKGARLAVQGLDLGRLQALAPPLGAALPPGTRLAGPLALEATGDGDTRQQQITLALDLGPATVVLPGTIHKEAGVALATQARLRYAPGLLQVESLSLDAGSLQLRGKGDVDLAAKKADLTITAAPFPLDGLVRLIPAIAAATPPGVSYAGTGSLQATVKGGGDALDGQLRVNLSGSRVEVPGARLVGDAGLDLTVRGNADDLRAELRLDLDGTDLLVPETLAKPAGTPAHLAAKVQLAQERLQIGQAELVLGPLTALVSGVAALGRGSSDLNLEVRRTELAPLAAVLLPLRPFAGGGGALALKMHVAGDAAHPGTLSGTLHDFELGLGRSTVRARGALARLDPLQANVDLSSPNLDLDELLALLGGGEAETESSSGGTPVLPADLELQGKLTVAQGVFSATRFRDLVADLQVARGVVELRTLAVKAFDGTISASGTRLDLSRPQPVFHARARMEKVDSRALLSDQTTLGSLLSGRLSATVDVQGEGFEFATFSRNLAGTLEGSVSDGNIHTANLLGSVVGPLLDYLPKEAARPPALRLGAAQGTPFRTLAGKFKVQGGKLNLIDALQLATPEGLVELAGEIGLDQALGLKGTYHLSPPTVAAMTANRYTPKEALPVALLVGGTLLAPRLEGVDLATTGRAIARGYLENALGGRVEDLRDQATERAREAVDAARQQAEQRAREAADQARQRAEQERRKAEEAARQAAQDAKERARKEAERARKRAEEEAKKRLHGLF